MIANCDAGDAMMRSRNVEQSGMRWSGCPIQRHTINDATGLPLSYDLAFLEFDDHGALALPAQRQELLSLLKSRRNNFVVYFVHGWRHDAGIGDPDVGRLRIVLAYFRSFMAQRCQLGEKRYCDAALTGVYVGWPGREVEEKGLPKGLANVAAGPSYLAVRGISSDVGPPIVETLAALQSDIKLADAAERSIVIAHSAGGNLVLTGLKAKVIGQLNEWQATRSGPLTLPVWDKAVLFNPASEAQNWIEIQQAVREASTSPAGQPREIFSDEQEPLIMAFTATCGDLADYGPLAQNKCDAATDKLFPISSDVLQRHGDAKRLTLGHYYDGVFGVTHIAADDSDSQENLPSSYASSITRSRCDPAPSWLYVTRHFRPHWNWDSFLSPGPDGRRPMAGRDVVYSNGRGQTVARQYAIGGANRQPITSPNDPFWNIRAAGQVVSDHGGYVSYTLLCSIFQAWNDGIAKPPTEPK